MGIEVNAGTMGSMAWKGFNTLLGAAGTAMGATALGSKTSENKVREIIREEVGGHDHGHNHNGYGRNVFDENIFISQPCSGNTLVNRFELEQNLEIASLRGKGYSDESDLKLFADYTTRFKDVAEKNSEKFEVIFKELVASRERLQAEVCRLDKEISLNKQANEYQAAGFCQGLAAVNGRVDAITKEVIPLSAICPQPLSGCVPVGFQGQIITTTPTGETNTVLSTARVATASASSK